MARAVLSDRCGAVRLSRPSVRGSPIQCQWVPGHRRVRSKHDILVSSPPPPPPDLERGGGERDGDGVEVAEVGDDHEGGLPPHPLLLLFLPLVLLPLAQPHRWQAVCHTGRPGIESDHLDQQKIGKNEVLTNNASAM